MRLDCDKEHDLHRAMQHREFAEQELQKQHAAYQDALARMAKLEDEAAQSLANSRYMTGLDRRAENLEKHERNLRIAQEAVKRAHEEEKETRRKVNKRMRRRFTKEHEKAVKELYFALLNCAAKNGKILRLQQQAADEWGFELPRFHWRELLANGHDSKLNRWLTEALHQFDFESSQEGNNTMSDSNDKDVQERS